MKYWKVTFTMLSMVLFSTVRAELSSVESRILTDGSHPPVVYKLATFMDFKLLVPSDKSAKIKEPTKSGWTGSSLDLNCGGTGLYMFTAGTTLTPAEAFEYKVEGDWWECMGEGEGEGVLEVRQFDYDLVAGEVKIVPTKDIICVDDSVQVTAFNMDSSGESYGTMIEMKSWSVFPMGALLSISETEDIPPTSPVANVWLRSTNPNIYTVTAQPGGDSSSVSADLIIVKVEIGDVVRAEGLPFSLPPTKTKDVNVTITPSLAGTGHSVTFDVINGSGDNGTATVTGNATRTTSGTITITGGAQTKVGNAENLKIRAKINDTSECGQSSGFTVCAHPSEVGFVFDKVLDPTFRQGKRYWGAQYKYVYKSDSGSVEDLDKSKIVEDLDDDNTETGFFVGSIPNIEYDFYSGARDDIYDTNVHGGYTWAATMRSAIQNKGNFGEGIYDQFHRFSCERCGIAEDEDNSPKVPKSGFKIRKFISIEEGIYYLNVERKSHENNDVEGGSIDDNGVKKAEIKD